MSEYKIEKFKAMEGRMWYILEDIQRVESNIRILNLNPSWPPGYQNTGRI